MPEVVMPRLSDTMEEGELSRWLKQEGDEVHKGDVLAEIETDKATMDLEAFDDGVLEKHLVAEGAQVPIGAPLAIIGDGSGVAKATDAEATDTEATDAEATDTEDEPEDEPGTAPAAAESSAPPRPAPAAGHATPAELRTSPLARRVAREHQIDIASLTGSGPGGRIVRADVEDAVAARAAEPGPDGKAAAEGATPPPAHSPTATVDHRRSDDVDEIPLSNIRRITARRLTESQSVPHFFLTSVVDVERLLALRAEINGRLEAVGIKISVNDLLVRACAVTLRAHPEVNASWGEDTILRHHRINIGIAVSLDDGLIVPVVFDADRKSLSEIGTEARALAERARAGRLKPNEFSGGTFTISNLGMFGIDQFTAVINPPEAAILAVGAARDEPVLREGGLVNVPHLKITLTVDHRVLDGASGAAFMRDLTAILEEPLRIVV
jgi:pyruvate dehydrogenase E2 component (dihydrolipoamide acetyltransferase)